MHSFNDSNATLSPELEDVTITIIPICISLAACALAILVAGTVHAFCWKLTSERQVSRLRSQLLSAILHQNCAWFDSHDTGSLIVTLTKYVHRLIVFHQYKPTIISLPGENFEKSKSMKQPDCPFRSYSKIQLEKLTTDTWVHKHTYIHPESNCFIKYMCPLYYASIYWMFVLIRDNMSEDQFTRRHRCKRLLSTTKHYPSFAIANAYATRL